MRVVKGAKERVSGASINTVVVMQPVRATQVDAGLHNKRAACWKDMEAFTGMKKRLNDYFSRKPRNGIMLGIWAAGHIDYLFVWARRYTTLSPVKELNSILCPTLL